MNAKIAMFVTCVEAIIYLLLCNLHDCTFNVALFAIQKYVQASYVKRRIK